jgi:hypothetical protein
MANVDTVRDAGGSEAKAPIEGRDPVPATVDWLLGFLAAGLGLVLAAVGTGMYAWVDRAVIAEFITAESTEVNGLTPAEAITASVPFVDWFSVGMVVTGLVLVAAGAGFVYARRQTRRRVASEGGTTATFWASAVYGTAVTSLVSFIPGAGIVGGGVAAYLQESGSGARVGAAAGLVGWALTAPLLMFLAVGLLAGAGAIDMVAGGAVLVGITVGSELLALAFNVGFGALGGYLANRLA